MFYEIRCSKALQVHSDLEHDLIVTGSLPTKSSARKNTLAASRAAISAANSAAISAANSIDRSSTAPVYTRPVDALRKNKVEAR